MIYALVGAVRNINIVMVGLISLLGFEVIKFLLSKNYCKYNNVLEAQCSAGKERWNDLSSCGSGKSYKHCHGRFLARFRSNNIICFCF